MTSLNKVKKKTGIFIQARLGSKRFPKKILAKISQNQTVLDFMILRLLKVFKRDKIFLLTTTRKEDKKLIMIANNHKISFFTGSENNLMKRYFLCAKKFNINKIVRLTSDCPLVDPYLIKKFLNFSNQSSKYKYYSNCAPYEKRTYAVGSDIEIFYQKDLNPLKEKITKYEKEHITPFLLKKKFYNFKNKENDHNLRFTIDYPKDLHLVKMIVKSLKKKFFSYRDIVNFLKKNPKIKKINSQYINIYYRNKILGTKN